MASRSCNCEYDLITSQCGLLPDLGERSVADGIDQLACTCRRPKVFWVGF
jgi:hypothetical protein